MKMNSLDRLRFRIQIGEVELMQDVIKGSNCFYAFVKNHNTKRIDQFTIEEKGEISSVNKLFFNL
jgi:hypothetical protein